ncbi:hypothetical protein QGP82_14065 [Leptothoe sp. LEGE 181152]|nr:hypothetical protein [Leptothoe sp. LEGE 181152]
MWSGYPSDFTARGIPLSYGERLSAIVTLLSGPYRHSYRQVCALMADLFSVRLSRGSVGRLRNEMSDALWGVLISSQARLNNNGRAYGFFSRDWEAENQFWFSISMR